jgi:hypothetical protein
MAAELPSAAPPTGDAPVQKVPAGKKSYQKIEMPTAEQIIGEDFMNNCAIRTGMSGVMGSVLGVFFGVFMGTMDTSVSLITLIAQTLCSKKADSEQLTDALDLLFADGGRHACRGAEADGEAGDQGDGAENWSPQLVSILHGSFGSAAFATCRYLHLHLHLHLQPPSISCLPISARALCRSYAKGFGAMGALFAGSECVVEKFRAKHDVYNSVYAGCSTGAILAYSAGPKAMCIGCASFAAFSALIDRFISH